MARGDAPFGFKPWGTILRKQLYPVNAAATVMFKYDMAKQSANGDLDAGTAGDGVFLRGSILACFDSSMLPTTYIADSATGYVLVADDPNQLYVVQEDLSGASLALTDVGQNLNLISTHRGNTTTGISKMEIDSSDKSAQHNAQFKIIACHPEDKKTSAAAHYRRWIVSLNYSDLGHQASGV